MTLVHQMFRINVLYVQLAIFGIHFSRLVMIKTVLLDIIYQMVSFVRHVMLLAVDVLVKPTNSVLTVTLATTQSMENVSKNVQINFILILLNTYVLAVKQTVRHALPKRLVLSVTVDIFC